MTPRGPVLKNEPERIEAVNTDQRAVFRVAENPNATDSNPFFVDIDEGKDVVAKFGGIIEMEAKKQGVDPDLVKAIMFAENARGNRLGLDQAFQDLGLANTFLPMNINPKIWGPLGINRNTADDPRVNIRTSVRLIKRFRDRIENPTAAKIGSVWQFTGREKVNDFGAYVGRIHREKPWRN